MISDKIIHAYETAYKASRITNMRLNTDEVFIPIFNFADFLQHLFVRKQAERKSIEGDFFGQQVENLIFEFQDGSCIVIGMNTTPAPYAAAKNYDEAVKINETIYY
ncbi:MAG: hypothetical protein KJN62_07825 [Deltaproteobacteria bacterium]|nr:hypothetical protein [Deltaproteobacteria bacterium]